MQQRTRATLSVVAVAVAVVLAALVAGCGSDGSSGSPAPSTATTSISEQQVLDLVNLTSAAIEKDAAGTFAAINAGQAPYVDAANPTLYVFVFNRDVEIVADPDPAFQGRSMKGVPDAAGKLFRDAMVAGALADGSGWVEYVKEEPGSTQLSRKASYYKLVTGSDGVQYVVGAGRYLGPWEGSPSPSASAATAPSKEQVKAFVDEAWSLAQEVGQEKALATFMDTNGAFYHDGLYVFAYTMDGTVLALPAEPDKVGENRWDAQDPAGAYFAREFVNVAKNQGEGWVTYQYINPAQGDALQLKTSYVRRVDDTWLLGAGTYSAAQN